MISVVVPVYRSAADALRLMDELRDQELPYGESMEIIVVDDGSNDGTGDVLRAASSSTVQAVSLAVNKGRAGACNAGAAVARGDHIVFIDCDCIPADAHLLMHHVDCLAAKHIACIGTIEGTDTGFWGRYQDDASDRRRRGHSAGRGFVGTTANFSVSADAFRSIGGFDPRYRRYGFEDRDFLVRLSRIGQIGWCDGAVVVHRDLLTLGGVLRKMQQAAGASASLFAHDHPLAYRELGYAKVDARIHKWLRPIGKLAGPVIAAAARSEPILNRRWLPYPVARTLVKMLVGLAYLHGTVEGGND